MSAFLDAAAAVQEPAHTVGATVKKNDHFHLTGNGSAECPALAPVGVDSLGRIWREDGNSLTCIYDPRAHLLASLISDPSESA